MLFVQQLDAFEGKLSKMTSQLDAQHELNKVADRKTKRAEVDLLDVEQKLRQLECASHLPADNAVLVEQEKVTVSPLYHTSHTRDTLHLITDSRRCLFLLVLLRSAFSCLTAMYIVYRVISVLSDTNTQTFYSVTSVVARSNCLTAHTHWHCCVDRYNTTLHADMPLAACLIMQWAIYTSMTFAHWSRYHVVMFAAMTTSHDMPVNHSDMSQNDRQSSSVTIPVTFNSNHSAVCLRFRDIEDVSFKVKAVSATSGCHRATLTGGFSFQHRVPISVLCAICVK